MGVFTLEVADRPVACICAETRAQAQERLEDPWFRDGLLGLGRQAAPVWHGEADLHIREASAEEVETVRTQLTGSIISGESQDQSEAIIFLPPDAQETPPDHKLILASRVEHTPVYNEAGERIGHIGDLSIDRKSGQVVYAIMSFGGFLGIGRRFHPLPWPILHFDPERGGYVVPLDKAALEGAPHYEADELWALGGPSQDDYSRHILDYYGRYGPPLI
jgi:hypothetical protein